ncbi:MAG TPA: 3-hydroxyacyl-ACP dehydratase FabZ family protein [Kofleriaceae bacterium]|jgi:3-hydroxymyristoyl/3-hydroxydecanoyl-(acyl carrier protein) dehydratase
MQAEEIDALVRVGKKRPLFEANPAHAVDLGRPQIERLLQHRDPFLFVETITHVDLEAKTIIGTRRIDPNDPLFVGHFPGEPIYPGVLQVESMGQLGLCLFALATLGRSDVRPTDVPPPVRGLKIHHAIFLEALRPGDEVRMLARSIDHGEYTGVAVGQLFRGDVPCCFAIMEVYFVEA